MKMKTKNDNENTTYSTLTTDCQKVFLYIENMYSLKLVHQLCMQSLFVATLGSP